MRAPHLVALLASVACSSSAATPASTDAAPPPAPSSDGGAMADASTTTCGTLDPSAIEQDEGRSFVVARNFGFRGDTPSDPAHSPLRLFEDGRELGPAHSTIADVRAAGAGKFLHAGNALYFSSSDGSDPRTNGRIYAYAGPCWSARKIDLVTVAPSSTLFATFQCHNQRIVESNGTIFIAYLAAIPYAQMATWRIARSDNEGQSFTTILEGGPTRPRRRRSSGTTRVTSTRSCPKITMTSRRRRSFTGWRRKTTSSRTRQQRSRTARRASSLPISIRQDSRSTSSTSTRRPSTTFTRSTWTGASRIRSRSRSRA